MVARGVQSFGILGGATDQLIEQRPNFFDQFMDEELHNCLQKLKENFSTKNQKEMEISCLEVQKKIMRQFSR